LEAGFGRFTEVGDIHRTLLYGGIFAYPADNKNQEMALQGVAVITRWHGMHGEYWFRTLLGLSGFSKLGGFKH